MTNTLLEKALQIATNSHIYQVDKAGMSSQYSRCYTFSNP
nr:MAG TPA: hypothetical protein [Caudoviricetes sp.]